MTQSFFTYDEDFREDVDPLTLDAVCRYAEIMSKYGVESKKANDFFEKNKHLPGFADLAKESRKLEQQFCTKPVKSLLDREDLAIWLVTIGIIIYMIFS